MQDEDRETSEVSSHDGVEINGKTGRSALKETKRAAAALCVGVGHFSDPAELPGLSHYLEHMLFMGSDKYPDENEYDAYLNKHNGSSNAFTEEETTTFYFECAPQAFRGALDRFAQFFIAPLIKSDALDREVQAVDSEFSGVLQSDSCRLSQARASLISDSHPASKFGWGNKYSLQDCPSQQGIDVRRYLLEYYKTHYSANRMTLVIISGEDIENMKSSIGTYFAQIPSGDTPRPSFRNLELDMGDKNIVLLPTSRDDHKISISFHLPSSLEKQYGKKAEDYVSHLVGHEGKGSLLSFLKERDWATDLCAGVADQTSAFWLFEVTITLTEQGLSAGMGFGLSAAQALFGYLDMLRSSEPKTWIWDEMKSISKIKWEHLEEEDPSEYVAQIAGDLQVIPMHHVLEWSFLHEEFDPSLIKSVLDDLVPRKAHIYVQSLIYDKLSQAIKSCSCISDLKTTTEPWFGFDMIQGRIDEAILTKSCVEYNFYLPKANPYIAKAFSLVKEPPYAHAYQYPHRIEALHSGKAIFHLMDRAFHVPKISSFFRFMHGIIDSSCRHIALTHILIKLLEDSLCEEAYLADMAGLHYSIYMDGHQSIDFRIEGFDEKLIELTSLIFSSFLRLEYTLEDFKRIKEVVHRHYSNALMKPTKHASFLRLQTLKHHHADPRDILEEIKTINLEDIKKFREQLAGKGHLTVLILGNCSEQHALKLSEVAATNLIVSDIAERHNCCKIVKMNGNVLRREVAVNPLEENSCVEYYIQVGSALEARNRALLDLVDHLIYEPCYNILRTQKQLGYIVSSGTRLTNGIQGLCVTIQSKAYAASQLERNIDQFLSGFMQTIECMSAEEFNTNKDALIEHKLSKATTLSDLCERHWDALVNRAADFQFRQSEIKELQNITQVEVIQYYKEHIVPGGSMFRKLVSHVDPQSRHPFEASSQNASIITKETLAAYHDQESTYPPLPHI